MSAFGKSSDVSPHLVTDEQLLPSSMSIHSTPMKRILTEAAREAYDGSVSPYHDIISDDLTTRLQNLGSRVRKSVSEGYATQRVGGMSSSTPTPFSSPVKTSNAVSTSQTPPIFRSASDTLIDVFSSPTRASAVSPSPSPSPRKRGHEEVDWQEESEECSRLETNVEDTLMMEMETLSDEEDITIITERNLDHCPSRPVRPLKKIARMQKPPIPSFGVSSLSSCSLSNSGPCMGETTNVTTEWKGMFNHRF